jgi:lipid-binding SYLF domain-containing protein
VLFMMNEKGAQSLVNKSKFTLGGNVAVAAGPFGRSGEAATDLNLNAEIYSYAKSKGLFAGISLEGASLAPSTKANRAYYGRPISPQSVLFANHAPAPLPTEAKEFLSVLPK